MKLFRLRVLCVGALMQIYFQSNNLELFVPKKINIDKFFLFNLNASFKMKILITGSNGLLGQKLCDRFSSQTQHQWLATSRGANRYPSEKSIPYESLDVTNRAEVLNVIQAFQPDCVIHTAAMTNVDACETQMQECDAMNVFAVEYLTEACNIVGAHLVHISTDFIFDGTHGPLSEDENPNPLSYYGLSKLRAEEIILKHAKSFSILRTVLVYGIVHDMSRNNIVLWAKKSLEEGKNINVVCDQFRTATLAEDLAQGCIAAAEKKAQGIYNISGKDFLSIYDMVTRIANFWNLDKSLIAISTSEGIKQPAKRPPITGFILTKAQQELNYHPHSLEEGLKLIDEQLHVYNRLS